MIDESGFSLRRRLYSAIRNELTNDTVLADLLPNGQPHLFERQMWDYKEELPVNSLTKLTPELKQLQDAKISEIVKDVVSFYNSYGGYLVVGVKDNPREVVGYDRQFDCDDLNKRIKGATRQDVGCTFALHEIDLSERKKKVGLLFIPQRPDGTAPAQFNRDAATSPKGKKAYSQNDIYFRQGDECLPARSSEDFSFLCSQGRRQFVASDVVSVGKPLSSNLRERDPGFIKFIGRDEYLQKLWQWLLDKYSPGKLLAGVGGIGKTTIAREFAEQLIKSSPFGFERIIWFSAKKRYYTASMGKYTPTIRVDFYDTQTLLRTLLLELGCPENMIDPDWSDEELISEVIDSLKVIPSLVIVDDVDSLEPAMQQDVFHTMLQVMTRAINSDGVSSRVLLTARLDLGSAPSQLIRVSGLDLAEFGEYVQMTASNLNLPWALKAQSPQMKEFHRVSSGSPSFAASILRLVAFGETLSSALNKWRGSEGNEVRAFAFEKELNNLSDSQIRTLFAMCLLGDSSQLELKQVTQSSPTLLMDDLGELRKYHLISTTGESPKGGARLTVPNWIRLMKDLIRSKVRDPKRIESACATARKESPDVEGEVGRWIYRVIALWRNGSADDALHVAQEAAKKFPSHADLRCLLGRAYLHVKPPSARHADAAFRKADELKCERVELLQLWILAKKQLKDWIGMIDITTPSAGELLTDETALIRAEAYSNLGDIAAKAGDYQRAAKYLLAGIDEIEQVLAEGSWGRGRELISMRALMYQRHIQLLERGVTDPNDYLTLWIAVIRAFRRSGVAATALMRGADRLLEWWAAVEKRSTPTKSSLDVLKDQIDVLRGICENLSRRSPLDTTLLKSLQNARSQLSLKAKEYQARL